MFPGMNMNSRQMRQAMKKMGVEQETIDAKEVIIKLEGKEIVFSNPEVTTMNMMGQETFQIAGEYDIQDTDESPEIVEEDIQTVIDQTHVSREEAIAAIQQCKGDLAEAIMALQSTGDESE